MTLFSELNILTFPPSMSTIMGRLSHEWQHDHKAWNGVPLRPLPQPKSYSWWVAQADQVRETCAKCEGPVEGAYAPPTPATHGECAVVAHCRLCGAERMVLCGRGGIPYEPSDLARARSLKGGPKIPWRDPETGKDARPNARRRKRMA